MERSTVERWKRIEQVFHEALRRDATARESYVSEACRGDGELFREVSSLLENDGEDGDFESWAPSAAAQLVVEPALLEPGHRLGPYRIDAFLAAGGMGQVYRATDTRLNREVAIKVSAARFSEHFETEAMAVASMNHPNICRLYDVGPNYLVMELVDGPTLADRIRRGPMRLSEALGVARQIAEALEAAHEKGSVHRDLKPGNIKMTADGVVKLLDFGLADIATEPSSIGAGTIAGTPAYMSPEQARGDSVDKRSDIWAFGAVLYELLTGKVAFAGRTTSDTLESIQQAEPDWSALPATTPARIRTLLRRCLEGDRKQRLRDIGEARIVIDTPDESPTQAPRLLRASLIAGVLMLLVIGSVSWWRATGSSAPHAAMRLSVELQSDIPLVRDGLQNVLTISPDDRRLVFTTRGADGVPKLASRILDQNRSTVLSGTEHAEGPFFSPDSEWIGFFADGKLKKISVHGGTPVSLSDAPGPRGASWGDDGNIIAALALGRLSRIPASGGRPTPLAEASEPNEIERWPQVLPGSQAVLFNTYQRGEDPENARIEILSFATGTRKIVARGSRVFLDLKYHDIPNTVASAAVEATRLGASIFNVHASGGREMMQRAADAVAEVASREGLSKPIVLGVTLLTSADQETLQQLGIADEPAQVVRRLAALASSANLDGVVASAHEIGIVRGEVSNPDFKIVCPGIRSASDPAHDQRRTLSAGEAVRAGADYVVVGRPILQAEDPVKAARAFRDEIDSAMANAIAMNQSSR